MHQGIRARDQLHRHLEDAIAEKLREDKAAEPGDALDMIIRSTRELGQELSVQELKVGMGKFNFSFYVPSRSPNTPCILPPAGFCLAPLEATGTPGAVGGGGGGRRCGFQS